MMLLTFCTETQSVWKLVGNILGVFKIVIPILVIIFGMIDLGKAVVASKDDEIKKAAKSLGMIMKYVLHVLLIQVVVVATKNNITLKMDICLNIFFFVI